MVIKNILKEKKGIIVSDAIISILIILLFTGLITSIMINIISEKSKIKLNSIYINITTEILEHVQKISFNEVTEENLINYVNDKKSEYFSAGMSLENLTTPYKIKISVENYIPENNETALNLIKIVKIDMQGTVGDKTYNMSVSRIKKAEESNIDEILENGNLL